MSTILSDLDSGRRSFLGGLIASAAGSFLGLFALPEYKKFYGRCCVWKGKSAAETDHLLAIAKATASANLAASWDRVYKRGSVEITVFELPYGYTVEVCETRRVG